MAIIEGPMNTNELLEHKCEAFYRATGHFAPGKDVPAALGYTEEQRAEGLRLWKVFCAGHHAGFIASQR